MSSNYITDLSAVALPYLEKLDVSTNQIISLEVIKKNTALKELYISGNQIGDLTPLLKLTRLEILDISNNPVSDYSVLYKMKQLKELKVTNISLETYNELRANLPGTRVVAKQIYKWRSSVNQ